MSTHHDGARLRASFGGHFTDENLTAKGHDMVTTSYENGRFSIEFDAMDIASARPFDVTPEIIDKIGDELLDEFDRTFADKVESLCFAFDEDDWRYWDEKRADLRG